MDKDDRLIYEAHAKYDTAVLTDDIVEIFYDKNPMEGVFAVENGDEKVLFSRNNIPEELYITPLLPGLVRTLLTPEQKKDIKIKIFSEFKKGTPVKIKNTRDFPGTVMDDHGFFIESLDGQVVLGHYNVYGGVSNILDTSSSGKAKSVLRRLR